MTDQDFNFDINSPPTIVCPDFETLSLDSDAVIIGMGSTLFTPGGEHRSFVSAFPINALGQVGRRADPDTVNWWSTRPDNGLRLCFQRAMAGDGPPLQLVLQKFLEECMKAGGERGVWWLFKPACFDGALFRHACIWAGLGNVLEHVGLGASRRRMLDLQSMRFAAAWAGIAVPENVKPQIQHHPVQDAHAQGQSGEIILTLLRNAVSGAPAPAPETIPQEAAAAFAAKTPYGVDEIAEAMGKSREEMIDAVAEAAPAATDVDPPGYDDALDVTAAALRGEGLPPAASLMWIARDVVALCQRYLDGDPWEGPELSYLGRFVHALIISIGQGLVVDGHELAAQALVLADGGMPDHFASFLIAVKRLVSDQTMCTDAQLIKAHETATAVTA